MWANESSSRARITGAFPRIAAPTSRRDNSTERPISLRRFRPHRRRVIDILEIRLTETLVLSHTRKVGRSSGKFEQERHFAD